MPNGMGFFTGSCSRDGLGRSVDSRSHCRYLRTDSPYSSRVRSLASLLTCNGASVPSSDRFARIATRADSVRSAAGRGPAAGGQRGRPARRARSRRGRRTATEKPSPPRGSTSSKSKQRLRLEREVGHVACATASRRARAPPKAERRRRCTPPTRPISAASPRMMAGRRPGWRRPRAGRRSRAAAR